MYVCNLIAFLCCVMFPVGLTEGRVMREIRGRVMREIRGRVMREIRDTCEHGNYTIEGTTKTCCFCSVGYKLIRDCTDTNHPDCDLCEPTTYLDYPNNDRNCLPCKICETEANMEVKEGCSAYSNTICRCKEDHYCDQGDYCRTCKPCDKCDEVETKCTETSNTVCKDAKEPTTSKGAIAAAVLVPLLIITICLVLFYLWKQKKDKKTIDTGPEAEQLKDLDLNPYLLEIADHLGWKVMKRVALHSGMKQASIDNHESSHPNDAKEQTYGLLHEWSQTQGLYEAYPALIKTLHAIKERRTADEIKKIIEKGQAKAQP
ncbi:unnamed protein product [Leuciscus chuanchicus]